MKTIVIAGASGFIGKHVQDFFKSESWQVLTIGRTNSDAVWSDQTSLVKILEGADAVVNLAGKSVNCRFTEANVRELIQSRISTTRAIGEALGKCERPPAVWINASGASIYREHVSQANTESSPTDGEGTMAEVARQWEHAFFTSVTPSTRKIALRISLVIGRDGGVLPIYLRLARLGLGGKQGSGRQMMSWIHIDDLVQLVASLVQSTSFSGVVNAAAPESLTNSDFMRTIRESVSMPIGFPAPTIAIRLGTFLIGASHELVLRGMWVQSEVAETLDFSYRYKIFRRSI